MSFIIKDLSYIHADKEILFSHLHLSINSGDKIALTGNNGCGKSTLMRILAGDLSPSSGTVLRPRTSVLRAPALRTIRPADNSTSFGNQPQAICPACHPKR